MAVKNKNEIVEKTEEFNGDMFAGLPAEVMAELTPAKVRMILLYLTGQYTYKKIGQIIGVSGPTVSSWLMDSNVQTAIREIQRREFTVIEGSLKALQHKAVTTMCELMDSTMDNVRYQAAKDILDRGGHRPTQSIKVEKTVNTVEQQLANLADFTISEEDIIDVDIDEIMSDLKND